MLWSLVLRMEVCFGLPLGNAILFKFKSVITDVTHQLYAKVDNGCHLKGTALKLKECKAYKLLTCQIQFGLPCMIKQALLITMIFDLDRNDYVRGTFQEPQVSAHC